MSYKGVSTSSLCGSIPPDGRELCRIQGKPVDIATWMERITKPLAEVMAKGDIYWFFEDESNECDTIIYYSGDEDGLLRLINAIKESESRLKGTILSCADKPFLC